MDPSAHWDALALRWDELLSDSHAFVNHEEAFRRFHWFMKKTVNPGNRTRSCRLLDLGCGTGEAGWPLWKRVASVTFLDRSPAMLRLTRNKCPKGVFIRGDAANPPFLDAEFDIIVSRGALLSQIDPVTIPNFFKHAWRVLRPQGLFLFDYVSNLDAWPGHHVIYHAQWTRAEMEALLVRHLPSAAVIAWDGVDRHAVSRVLIRK